MSIYCPLCLALFLFLMFFRTIIRYCINHGPATTFFPSNSHSNCSALGKYSRSFLFLCFISFHFLNRLNRVKTRHRVSMDCISALLFTAHRNTQTQKNSQADRHRCLLCVVQRLSDAALLKLENDDSAYYQLFNSRPHLFICSLLFVF